MRSASKATCHARIAGPLAHDWPQPLNANAPKDPPWVNAPKVRACSYIAGKQPQVPFRLEIRERRLEGGLLTRTTRLGPERAALEGSFAARSRIQFELGHHSPLTSLGQVPHIG